MNSSRRVNEAHAKLLEALPELLRDPGATLLLEYSAACFLDGVRMIRIESEPAERVDAELDAWFEMSCEKHRAARGGH